MKQALPKLLPLFLLCCMSFAQKPSQADTGWPTYGGDPGGTHFTAATQITRANLAQLAPAWTFHTHALDRDRPGRALASFEATPIIFAGRLYVSTPFDDIFALDPATGAQLWSYDARVVAKSSGVHTSRGVAAWPLESAAKPTTANSPCAARIFIATLDDRLLALDAATGKPCADFGNAGEVDLASGVNVHPGEEYFFSSPPTVVGNVVIVGSGIGDNQRVDSASGVVRAFDVHTGRLAWSWDPIPWAKQQALSTGSANAWSIISADPAHDLIFVPTGAPSPDFYGGTRPGNDPGANSVVALQASTGKQVWSFQAVHHDLWDYDVPSEPVLFTFHGTTPAIAITTKMGLLFVLNRITGEPLYPIEERPVPASDVPGEAASPTQPFQQIASLAPISFPSNAMLGDTPDDDAACRKLIAGLRYEGIYTPPSLRGTLVFPGNLGGVNWGGAAVDPATGILYANTNRAAFSVTFAPRPTRWQIILHTPEVEAGITTFAAVLLVFLIGAAVRRRSRPGWPELIVSGVVVAVCAGVTYRLLNRPQPSSIQHFGHEAASQLGTPYTAVREELVAPASGHLCAPQPWGTVSAVNLNTGQAVFQTPLGTIDPTRHTGTLNLGGDLVTASGLLFTGAARDALFRAFDATTGAELWKSPLPAPAQATPMSYTVNGRQFIVIAAGGHGLFGTAQSDALAAFAIPARQQP